MRTDVNVNRLILMRNALELTVWPNLKGCIDMSASRVR